MFIPATTQSLNESRPLSLALLAIVLFVSIFLLVLYGYPVAFTLGGLSLLYAFCFLDTAVLTLLPSRVMGVMENSVLLAVPLFIFMGIMLEKSGLAERMLRTMSELFGRVRGGMAVSVIIVGALLAASTGIVGATVVTMGLISLPPMLKRGYSPGLSTGVIAASGTLGQIIPPSVVLVLLGSVLGVSVGKLFKAALVPSLLLVGAYIAYVLLLGLLKPKALPPGQVDPTPWDRAFAARLLRSLLLPFTLIVAVLGSILAGWASPTEAAAIGAAGAMILTALQRKLDWATTQLVCRETTHLTSMVFMILLGATTFSLVFREMGGDSFLVQLIERSDLTEYQFLTLVMVVIFIAGFFIDFIEIVFIIVPVVTPLFAAYGTDLIWLGILFGINLQTSFLSPPFGFALFYLKGVAPPEVKTVHLYRGILPFLVIQVLLMVVVIWFPEYVM